MPGGEGAFLRFRLPPVELGKPINAVDAELLAAGGQVAHPDGLPAAAWFLNINTAEDLRRAAEHFRVRSRKLGLLHVRYPIQSRFAWVTCGSAFRRGR